MNVIHLHPHGYRCFLRHGLGARDNVPSGIDHLNQQISAWLAHANHGFELCRIYVRAWFKRHDTRRLDFLEPHALPYATLCRIPHVSANDALFSTQLSSRLTWIPYAEHNRIYTSSHDVGNIRVEGQVSSPMLADLDAVDVDSTAVVNGLKVQQ